MSTDGDLLRGYIGSDETLRAALERVLLRAELNAIDENSSRFLMREWKAKAEDYRRERDALMDSLASEAAIPCRFPGAMSTCMDRRMSMAGWCRPCWTRGVLRAVVV